MAPAPLTGKQRRHLRALGHGLAPVLHVGRSGLSDAVVSAANEALETHELIKVRFGQNTVADRADAARRLAELTESEVAQVLGNTVLLYRRHPEEPKIDLP